MNRYVVKYMRKSANGEHTKECRYIIETRFDCTMREIKDTICSIKSVSPERISIKGINVYTI